MGNFNLAPPLPYSLFFSGKRANFIVAEIEIALA